jgi:predicted unusual protein kinase regulating ubiquinone biosynthesis (AarF/ABC1/UbiB family)
MPRSRMGDERKLPVGRISRMAKLAMLGARTGASMLIEKRGELAAEHAADVLGSMRGLAAKVGQMASYVDGIVPESKRDAFEAALGKLRAQAPTSSSEAVRRAIEAELGAKIEDLFASFEDEPFASASIGQVHRARLHEGTEVAVKVQHPGIEEAVEHDLKNGSMLASIKSAMIGSRYEAVRVANEIAQQFREELDYELEAERQAYFARLFAGEDAIRIPRVVPERSKKRVMTSELVRGLSYEEAIAASEEERRAWAETLWRFVFRSMLVGGYFNADPHPGNFIFHEGGAITALDFGCVVRIPPERQKLARAVHHAASVRDERLFRREGALLMATRGGPLEEAVLDYLRHCFVPLFDSPYRITRGYAASLIERLAKAAPKVLRAKKDEFIPFPEGMAFLNRLQFGFYSILARFDVAADYAAVERAILSEAPIDQNIAGVQELV